MATFQYTLTTAPSYYSNDYGITWKTSNTSFPRLTTGCMSNYGDVIVVLSTSSSTYYKSVDYGQTFTSYSNAGLNQLYQKMVCNDTGQFQLVLQDATNLCWYSYDYGLTFSSKVITILNVSSYGSGTLRPPPRHRH